MTYTPSTPTVPWLLDSDVHTDLRRSLRKLLDAEASTPSVLEHIASGDGHDAQLWMSLADDLGVTTMLVPEELGGSGATVREVAVVMEELGRSVAPVPYLASSVLATTVLSRCLRSGHDRAAEVLRRLVDGQIAALVVPAVASPVDDLIPSVELSSGRLNGTVDVVLSADVADVLIVPVSIDGGIALVLVEAAAAGVSITRRTSTDQSRPVSGVCFVDVEGVELVTGQDAIAAVTAALEVGAVLLAAEAVGICDWAVDEAVKHLTLRHQFGRPLGSNQALRHRAAEMWIDAEQSRAIAVYAAACSAQDLGDRHIAMTLAKPYATTAALDVVERCLQLHGGIGFTWESGVHLRLKRALTDTVLLGTGASHHHALGALVELEPPVEVQHG